MLEREEPGLPQGRQTIGAAPWARNLRYGEMSRYSLVPTVRHVPVALQAQMQELQAQLFGVAAHSAERVSGPHDVLRVAKFRAAVLPRLLLWSPPEAKPLHEEATPSSSRSWSKSWTRGLPRQHGANEQCSFLELRVQRSLSPAKREVARRRTPMTMTTKPLRVSRACVHG